MLQSKPISKRLIFFAVLMLFALLAVRVYLPVLAQQPDTSANELDTSVVEIPVIFAIFTQPAIQQDIALTDNQIAEILALEETLEQQRYAVRDAAARKGIAVILDREQHDRYSQIMLRGLAVRAFGVTDVIEGLDLTKEQRHKIAKIRGQLKLQLKPFQTTIETNGPPKDYSEAMSLEKDTATIHADAYQQALGVLTSTQRKTYNEMIGPTVNPQ